MSKRRLFGADRFSLRDSPVFGVAVVLLFTLGIVLLPGEKTGKLFLGEGGTDADAGNLGNAIFRAAGFGLAVLLALDLGLDIFGFAGRGRGFLLALPFVAVAVNNAPLVGFATGKVTVEASAASYVLFAVNCLFVGLFEEIMFRGLILPLVLRKLPRTRKGIFWSVILSSALFGAIHAVNFFSSALLPVVLQIGYSFLVGAMCAMVLLLTRNIFACALLHGGFNFCGLLADELGTGQVWNAVNITLTAVVGVFAAAYGVYILYKRVHTDTADKLFCVPFAQDPPARESQKQEP